MSCLILKNILKVLREGSIFSACKHRLVALSKYLLLSIFCYLQAITAGVVHNTSSLADTWLAQLLYKQVWLIIFALIYQHATEINRSTASFLSAVLFGVMCSKSEDLCANSLFMTESKVSGFKHYKPDDSSNKHTKGSEHTHSVPPDLCYQSIY